MTSSTLSIKKDSSPQLGAIYLGDGRARFHVWAPFAKSVDLEIDSPDPGSIPMEFKGDGYFDLEIHDIAPGLRYRYRLNRQTSRPDPASRCQQNGVDGPSTLVDSDFSWTDQQWKGIDRPDLIFYELHVGAFTPDGTFDGAIRKIPHLKKLGVTAVEIMPVAQFPGSRNWGYDGVYPFAVQDSYGGPDGLKRFVDACHQNDLAVILDVVYNHLGPEGNYLNDFGPYFTDAYKTPWGRALNFDGEWNHHVRRFFIENALMWVTDYHLDGLRLDAIHAICDFSAEPFLKELGAAVHRRAGELDRRIYLFPESDLNDSKIVRPPSEGGAHLDAQWCDDFHHALHALLTGEKSGYYGDFGSIDDLADAYQNRFVYDGKFSNYRKRLHGNKAADLPPEKFIVFSQNHDQVGNRMKGDRLTRIVSVEALKLAAGCVILSPFLPLLFMGEEFGETAPFQYFISHTDPKLVEAVRKGRRSEFRGFGWTDPPPDPQDPSTFNACKLSWKSNPLFDYYSFLINLRRTDPALGSSAQIEWSVEGDEKYRMLYVRSQFKNRTVLQLMNFEHTRLTDVKRPDGNWDVLLDSADARWLGPGSDFMAPHQFLALASKGA